MSEVDPFHPSRFRVDRFGVAKLHHPTLREAMRYTAQAVQSRIPEPVAIPIESEQSFAVEPDDTDDDLSIQILHDTGF